MSVSADSVAKEIASLRQALEECKRQSAPLISGVTDSPIIDDAALAIGKYCTPINIMIAVAIPVVLCLLLYIISPSLIKVQDGETQVVSVWQLVKWTLIASAVGWGSFGGWVFYTGGFDAEVCMSV